MTKKSKEIYVMNNENEDLEILNLGEDRESERKKRAEKREKKQKWTLFYNDTGNKIQLKTYQSLPEAQAGMKKDFIECTESFIKCVESESVLRQLENDSVKELKGKTFEMTERGITFNDLLEGREIRWKLRRFS